MAGLMLGGLASGMDTQAIIAQLMAIERQPKTRLTMLEKRVEARKAALEEVSTRLRALMTSLTDLRSVTTWADLQVVASSDATKVAARQVGSAPPGNFTIDVHQLARVEQRTYSYMEKPGGPQELTIDGKVISIPRGTTVQGVADLINGTSGVTVYGGVVNGQLVLTGKTVGQGIAVSSRTTSVTEDTAKQVLAHKTTYSINGVLQPETTASTVQSASLPGIELTLKAVTQSGSPVTVTIGTPTNDNEKIQTKTKAFVDAYNAAIELIHAKLNEKPVAQPVTNADYGKGALRGDLALGGLLGRLRQAVGEAVADPAIATSRDELAEIGVSVPAAQSGPATAERLLGKLTLDATKLADALAADPSGVEKLLGGVAGVSGITQKLEGLVNGIIRSGDGVLANRASSADSELARLRRRGAEMDKRLELKEQRLRAQFTAMERALAMSQSQSSWLAGQLNGLS